MYCFAILAIIVAIFYGCDKVTIEVKTPPLPVHQKDEKPGYPVPLGCIRGYFGDEYRTFGDHIEKVAAIDSFSNCYFYSSGRIDLNQINLIRCDLEYVVAIYINGYPLDSLPTTLPVLPENGKFAEIQFYPLYADWNSPNRFSRVDVYGKSIIITDTKDDILTGTFEGALRSTNGYLLPVTEGEFRLKIFRKYMSLGDNNGK